MRVIVGMSGGVDSAVTAYLLKLKGYDVIGVTLRIVSEDGEVSRCCEIDDAREVCEKLEIPYYVRNCSSRFNSCVIDPFVASYACGRTPNPCIICNRRIKWEELIAAADTFGAEYVATGHYAKIVKLPNGRYSVKTSDHAAKDQSYMLCRLSQHQLQRTIMPLGELTKDEVRAIAKHAQLSVADKAESQEICFVPDDDYASYIEYKLNRSFPEGDFVDEEGKALGRHKGIIHYTVGQRKGLGIAAGVPIYVKKIDTAENKVVLSSEASLYSSKCRLIDVNYVGMPCPEEAADFAAKIKVRYHHRPVGAICRRVGEELLVAFNEPVKAVAPGQTGVLYDEDGNVLAGGEIRI